MCYCTRFRVESVLCAKEAQRNMGEKQLGWWYYMGVHIVWWVGHPSGRLQLPKVVSLSVPPGPAATHTPLACSSYEQTHVHFHRDRCTYTQTCAT